MYLRLNEDEVTNGAIVAIAQINEVDIDDVEAELMFNPEEGFWAEGKVKFGYMRHRKETLSELTLIEGIKVFLAEFHHFIPENITAVRLQFTEGVGVWAEVGVNEVFEDA